MSTLTIKKITFGEGIPKICIPITGRNEDEIRDAAEAVSALPHDVVEWRADYFGQITDPDCIRHILAFLKEKLPGSLLLFTFRTKKEGGVRELSDESYLELCKTAARSGFADLLDLELFTGAGFPENQVAPYASPPLSAPEPKLLAPVISLAHAHGCHIILSSHDFLKTPPEDELFRRLSLMEAMGADLAKLAVMPETKQDVLKLLSVTRKAADTLRCPVITMSMGKLGAVSRISGGLTGSCLTFGTAKEESAPGQLPAGRLKKILDLL